MSGNSHDGNRGVLRTLIDNSFLLIAGAVIALVWANIDPSSYHAVVHYDVTSLWGGGHEEEAFEGEASDGEVAAGHGEEDTDAADRGPSGSAAEEASADPGGAAGPDSLGHAEAAGESHEHEPGASHGLTLHFIINDILMALFFAIAAKEVWESLLPGGALANPRRAATPLMATVGGILGPALVYLGGAYLAGSQQTLGDGWAVPCATDIAFSYLVARYLFGATHPAIAFLLLLAIADDAAGLVILAVFYPQAPIQPEWLLLTVGAILLGVLLRRMRVHNHWVYLLIPGVLSWLSFYQANIHPALGLVPIIPVLPHAHTDLGLFARNELQRDDTLNEFEHFWRTPVEVVLGLFGLANAGVVLSSLGTGTWLVLAGLLIGKPLGITLMTLLAEKGMGLEKPAGMDYRHIVSLGMVAGIGFTVALFVSVAAFPDPGAIQDSVKMGALLSFGAAPLAILIGKSLGIRPVRISDSEDAEAPAA